MAANNKEIIDALIEAYNGEIETISNYIACSVNPDGLRAMEVREALEEDIQEELGHAKSLAMRIKTIGGTVPGSKSLKMSQDKLQPPGDSVDILSIIKGVIDAEQRAIDVYQKIIQLTDGVDFATQDLAISHLADEQEHKREFEGFLRGFEKGL